MTATTIAAVSLVGLACVPDLRTRRIPNRLTLGAAAVAVAFHTATSGWTGLTSSTGGWLAGLALFLPIFALRGMGGGDVKLLAAVGAWLGPAQVVWVALITSIAGGILGVAVALTHGYLRTALSNVGALLTHWRLAGRIEPLPAMTLEGSASPRLAYAIPIAIGTVMTLWLE